MMSGPFRQSAANKRAHRAKPHHAGEAETWTAQGNDPAPGRVHNGQSDQYDDEGRDNAQDTLPAGKIFDKERRSQK